MPKVWVDQKTCIGCELCVAICPSVFQMNVDRKSEAKTPNLKSASPECQESKDACPVSAIHIE